MTKRKIVTALSALLIITSILFTMLQNKPKNQVLEESFFYLGTLIKISIYDHPDPEIMDVLQSRLAYYDKTFDRKQSASDIGLLNLNKRHRVSDETYAILEKALYYSDLSQGHFDITINPIVDLWQIGTDQAGLPSQDSIDEKLQWVDYRHINLQAGGWVELQGQTSLDIGGIAKGYIADALQEHMRQVGIEHALINLGGNVYALGDSPDSRPWNIGIKHPEKNHTGSLLMLSLTDKSIVTSGVSERFFVSKDKTYHHILSPFTGYPIDNDLLSVTIISDASIDGDALATAMFALGSDKAFDLIKTLEGVEMIMVTNNKTIYYSPALEDKLELFDASYQVIQK